VHASVASAINANIYTRFAVILAIQHSHIIVGETSKGLSSKRPTRVGETFVDQWFVVETSVLRVNKFRVSTVSDRVRVRVTNSYGILHWQKSGNLKHLARNAAYYILNNTRPLLHQHYLHYTPTRSVIINFLLLHTVVI